MDRWTERDLLRFVNLLGMTQSPHDGEALNALRMVNRILASKKLTWRELLILNATSRDEHRGGESREYRTSTAHKDMATDILDSGIVLTAKEYDFVTDMLSWKYPTPAQVAWLTRIHKRA